MRFINISPSNTAFNVFIDKNAVVVGEVVDCQLFGRKIEVRVSKARRQMSIEKSQHAKREEVVMDSSHFLSFHLVGGYTKGIDSIGASR